MACIKAPTVCLPLSNYQVSFKEGSALTILTKCLSDKTLIVPKKDAERVGISKDRLRVDAKCGGPGYPAFLQVLINSTAL